MANMISTIESTNNLMAYCWDILELRLCEIFSIQFWVGGDYFIGDKEFKCGDIPNPFDRLPLWAKLNGLDSAREQKPMYYHSVMMIIESSIQRLDSRCFIAFCQQMGCQNEPATIIKNKVFCKECGDELRRI